MRLNAIRTPLLTTLALIFISASAFATQYIAGDIRYQCEDVNATSRPYRFELTLYVECGADDLGATVNVLYHAPSIGIPVNDPDTIVLFRENMSEVDLYCTGIEGTICTGGTTRGVNKYLFSATEDLIDVANAADFTLYYTDGEMSSNIDNIQFPNLETFYVETQWNNTANTCFSAPKINNELVFVGCVGESLNITSLISPPANPTDSVAFRFINPKTSNTESISYTSTHLADSFMIQEDIPIFDADGGFSITPTAPMIAITGIEIQHFSANILISTSTKTIQIHAIECNNVEPDLSNWVINNLSTGSDTLLVCAGDSISARILGTDPNIDQLITLAATYHSQPTWYTIENNISEDPYLEFKAATTEAEVGTYLFRFRAIDNDCANPITNIDTFWIQVVSKPSFTLGPDKGIACDVLETLDPVIVGGNSPFTYAWNTGETDTTRDVGFGFYELIVTDVNGCFFQDDVELEAGITAELDIQDRCFNDTTKFIDLSTSDVGAIVYWEWDFGDGNDSIYTNYIDTLAHFVDPHLVDTFTAVLIVEDETTCRDTIEYDYYICAPYDVAIDTTMTFNAMEFHCSRFDLSFSTLIIDPITGDTLFDTMADPYPFGCGLMLNTWDFGNGEDSIEALIGMTMFDTAGVYTISVETETLAGCEAMDTITLEITETVDVSIIEDDYMLDCTVADTTLHADISISPEDSAMFTWQYKLFGTSAAPVDITGAVDTFLLVEDMDTGRPQGSAGYSFFITITDSLPGCFWSDTVNIYYPVHADFRWTPFCYAGDDIDFSQYGLDIFPVDSFAHAHTVQTYTWNYGDGNEEIKLPADKNANYTYATHDIFTASLVVEDQTGCKDSIAYQVNNTPIQHDFSIQPDSLSYCAYDVIDLIGDKEVNGESWSNIASNGWYVDSVLYSYTYDTLFRSYAPDTFNLEQRLIYNVSTINDTACYHTNYDTIIYYPQFAIAVDGLDIVCLFDTAHFAPIRTVNEDIAFDEDEFVWNITWNAVDADTTTYTVREPWHIFRGFPEEGNKSTYSIQLSAMDVNGCYQKVTPSKEVTRVELPIFSFDTVCANEITTLTKIFQDTIMRNLDAGIDTYIYRFENGDSLAGVMPMPAQLNIFNYGGEHEVSLTVTDIQSGCAKTYTDTILALPVPNAVFLGNEVCLGGDIILENQTTQAEDTIDLIDFVWSLDDVISDTTTDVTDNITYTVTDASAPNRVIMIAQNSLGCYDTTIVDLVVNEMPRALFSNVSESGNGIWLEGSRPLEEEMIFTDRTQTDSSEIVAWYWDFGDNVTSLEEGPISHPYDSIKVYNITFAVENDLGCKDTIVSRLDLAVYLELPTAFSPNGDNNNDYYKLIKRGIVEVIDYKIFNRYGELVFTSDDLNAEWDGTHNGQAQPAGMYVVLVKAIGRYGIRFNKTVNLTLIR